MSDKPKPPPCPCCGNRSNIQCIAETFKCLRCGGLYDSEPDEGGSYSEFNPSWRMEREERERERRRKRLGDRRER